VQKESNLINTCEEKP
jgi:hypothetical protein